MQDNNERTVLKVSELNAEVALLLNSGFPRLWVEGEISNLAQPASGHLYFSLKDNQAQVRCAMFRNRRSGLQLKPENGQKVIVRVKVGLYEPRGEFQLVVEHMEDAGVGQLQKAFEALKKKLANKGLFAEEHKQPVPTHPRRIGVITSPSGAAIRDIINVLSRRAPHIPVLIYPVAVQGEKSAPEIIRAIQYADEEQKCDVLLLTRGGGSIEDLWSFNEEQVANAIYACKTPIVTGVGHEIDFTIADFVSDQRAPTPSAAAELLSPDRQALLRNLQQLQHRLQKQWQLKFVRRQEKLHGLSRRLANRNPQARLQNQAQKLDEYELRLSRSLLSRIQLRKSALEQARLRLLNASPRQRLKTESLRLEALEERLSTQMQRQWQSKSEQLALISARLNTLSPLATLDRGYAIVRSGANIVRSIKQLSAGRKISLMLTDGTADCTVDEARKNLL